MVLIFNTNKRKYIILLDGFSLNVISLLFAISAVPSDILESDTFLISSLFEGIFDDISEPTQIMLANVMCSSYSTCIFDVFLLWEI